MATYKYNFKEKFKIQLNKLIDFDKIRIGKILELFQYSIISYIFIIIVVLILNKFIFIETKEEIEKKSTQKLIIIIFLKLFLIVFVYYYLVKIILLFPSLPAIYIEGFREHSTTDYFIHIIVLYLLLENVNNLKTEIEILHDKFLRK